MKVFVKTLKGTSFAIEVDPQDKVADVKRAIEASHGKTVYPAEQQMLIHSGKVLKDETTLAENNVAENGFLVIMLTKTKGSSSGTSTTASTPANQTKGSSSGAPSTASTPANQAPPTSTVPAVPSSLASSLSQVPAASLTSFPTTAPTPDSIAAPSPAVSVSTEADVYHQAASNLVAGSNLEQTIQQLLDMGGGTWDRDTVSRALRAAYNNPERAVEYLYSGIPDNIEAPPVSQPPATGASTPAQIPQPVQPQPPSAGPNANPLDLFPQGLPSVGTNTGAGNLEFLRNSPQFRALQSLVQANPQILQPMLQELAKQNPQIMRLIQEHQGEFLRLINEPVEEGAEGNLPGQLAAGVPQAIQVTPEEREAIERLEAMGFDRALVVEVFFACNKNEELAANYLLDHMHEF